MKFFNKLFLGLGGLLLLLFIYILFVKVIASQATTYLKLSPEKEGEESLIIQHVNIVPMNKDTILRNKSIWIKEGIIHQISDSIAKDLPTINALGKYLCPGLVDMHAHLMDEQELGLYLSNGVTSIRNLMGMPFHLEIKSRLEAGELLGPVFFTSSPQFTSKDDDDIEKIQIQSPEHGREMVRKFNREGYDLIKTYNQLSKPVLTAIIEEAQKEGIPIAAHPSFEVDYSDHFQKGISTVEHTEDIVQQALNYTLDTSLLPPVVQGYVNSGQTHCPTLVVYHSIVKMLEQGDAFVQSEKSQYHNPFIRGISEDDYEFWTAYKAKDSTITDRVREQHEFHIEILRRLHNEGVNIVCGTDAGVLYTPAGFSIHEELHFYREAGMTPYEALKTATYNPTLVYPEFQSFGTVEEGKMANLIISAKNPLENLATLKEPEYVLIKGYLLDKKRMTKLKEEAYNRNNYVSTFLRYTAFILWGKG